MNEFCSELDKKNFRQSIWVQESLRWVSVILIFFIPISTSLTGIFSLLFIALLFFSGKHKEISYSLNTPIVLSLLYFVLINIVGVFYTDAPLNDVVVAVKKSARFLLFPLLLPVFKDRVWQNRGLWALIAAIFILVLLGYYNYFHYGAEVTLKDRIYTSSFVAFQLFILTLFITEKKTSKLEKILLSALIIVSFNYLMFINSGRIGQIIFLILFSILLLKKLNKNILKGAIVVLLLIIAVGPLFYSPVAKFVKLNREYILTKTREKIISPPTYYRYKEVYRKSRDYFTKWYHHSEKTPPLGEDSSIRLELYARTLKLCIKKPIAGYGTGSFTTEYNKIYPERLNDGIIVSNPHNQYLLTFFEHGISGLIALFIIFYSLGRQAFLVKESFEAIALLGVLSFMVIGCMVNSWLLDFTSSYFYICVTAMICARTIYDKGSLKISSAPSMELNSVSREYYESKVIAS